MSFIDKIKVKNTLYDIQDTNSREILDIITPKNVASGRLLHFTDGLPLATFENKISGNYEQETTKGNQLVDFSNMKLSSISSYTFENDVLTVSSSTDDGTYNGIYEYITDIVKNNAGKVLKFGFESIDTSNFNGSSSSVIQLIVEVDGTKSYKPLLYKSGATSPYTIPTDTSNITKVSIFVYTNNTATPIDSTIIITKPLLYFDDNSEYEPYTGGQASPNPEYPQEIEVVEGDLSYKVNGKNYYNANKSHNFTANNNDWYFIDGTSKAYGSTIGDKTIFKAPVKSGKTYTFRVGSITTTSNLLQLVDGNENIIQSFDTSTILDGYTFTVKKDGYVLLRFFLKANESLSISQIQLELGNQATEYEPYKEQTRSLDLKGNWIGSLQNGIKDYVITDKKKYWLVKNVGKVVLDGSESWQIDTTKEITQVFALWGWLPNNISDNNSLLSNYFINRPGDTEKISFSNDQTKTSIFIAVNKTTASTVVEFKKWLSEHNTTFYHGLKEPQIIELGELPEPIKTFEGTNNIQVIANLDTDIETTYAVDIKKYTDNKLAEISSQII